VTEVWDLNTYTAEQIAEILRREGDEKITKRTVQYYVDIGVVPELEVVGKQRRFTDKHLDYFRAIRTITRTGATLREASEKLQSLSPEEVEKIGRQLNYCKPETLIETATRTITPDVSVVFSPRVKPELKERIVQEVTRILEEES
jgi:DNA-binding transcriptional MerR regulator